MIKNRAFGERSKKNNGERPELCDLEQVTLKPQLQADHCLGYMTFRPIHFQPMLFQPLPIQPLTISTYCIFNRSQFRPKLILAIYS